MIVHVLQERVGEGFLLAVMGVCGDCIVAIERRLRVQLLRDEEDFDAIGASQLYTFCAV